MQSCHTHTQTHIHTATHTHTRTHTHMLTHTHKLPHTNTLTLKAGLDKEANSKMLSFSKTFLDVVPGRTYFSTKTDAILQSFA